MLRLDTDIHFTKPVDGRLMIQRTEFIAVQTRHQTDASQPVVDQAMAEIFQGRADAAAAVVAADDDVLHLEDIDRILQDGQHIEIRFRDDVGDVAMHENLSRRQTGDLVGGHATVRAADPEILGALLVRQAGKELRIGTDHGFRPFTVRVEEVLKVRHRLVWGHYFGIPTARGKVQVSRVIRLLLILTFSVGCALAAPKKVAVFVALCDNASQGIIPVPAKIGDGNKPEDNLYWGCTEGLPTCLKAGKSWKLLNKEVPDDKRILERCIFIDTAGTLELTIEGWRGSEIGACLTAFETALVSGKHDLCAYIGHNVLMDRQIEPLGRKATKPVDAIVLCCQSSAYFHKRLLDLGARPVLLTTQFMYPGGFLLRDTLPLWANGKSTADLRTAAGASYARNQNISTKAGTGVFFAIP